MPNSPIEGGITPFNELLERSLQNNTSIGHSSNALVNLVQNGLFCAGGKDLANKRFRTHKMTRFDRLPSSAGISPSR